MKSYTQRAAELSRSTEPSRDVERDRQSLNEIRAARAARLDEMRAILDKVKAESRDFSRRESARLETLDREIVDFDERIAAVEASEDPDHFDGRRAAHGSAPSKRAGIALTREESVADAVGGTRSFGDFGPAGDGIEPGYNADDFDFGRMVRAAVTGERHWLTEAERRAMGEGSDATGGVHVPEVLSGKIIDMARAKSVAIRAGALTLPMESDTTVLARLVGGNDAIWHAENAPDIVASDQEWERVELKAKTVVTEQKMSRELFEDAGPGAHAAIMNELAQTIGLAVDLAVFEGSGVGEPLGLSERALNEISMGVNGAAPTSYAELVRAAFAVSKENGADPTALVAHPRDLESYALLTDSTGQPLRRPDAIRDLPFLSTTQIATDRDQGTSTGVASNAYLGDFGQVILGVRPSLSLRFVTLTERYATPAFQIGILCFMRMDVAVGHEEHLTKLVGLLEA
jgi:HK97 family phage major capsid protein